ncbi:hypothetical protein BBJ29_007190 [Phytophthora kernoviae]|uniref:FHA domain-containing protein n=1 Tax=Phytophthora kernoviae TaxID=325452 RepID=A0A3F2RF07_9STRA|nr:hypothetical protein BBJ29_007190 [Phytophthora kernoviae]RLN55204.1 hypothetical protein BBP00_00008606 [Phytophthora kernoviae]
MRAEELRREMEVGKKVLLDALEAEKENIDKDGNIIPQALTISLLYEHEFADLFLCIQKRHSSCFIGRSSGRKFRSPRGLSMPKDSELSTTHAELKMETTGKIFFIDLDSTNGSRIDDVELEPHEPFELRPGKPIKVEIGTGELEFILEQKS